MNSSWRTGLPILASAIVILFSSQAGAVASSCVTCHLDEAKLTDSLAEVKTKASAKQSGAG